MDVPQWLRVVRTIYDLPTTVVNNQVGLTSLIDLIAIMQFNQGKLYSTNFGDNPS
jgi:hypothetical protein